MRRVDHYTIDDEDASGAACCLPARGVQDRGCPRRFLPGRGERAMRASHLPRRKDLLAMKFTPRPKSGRRFRMIRDHGISDRGCRARRNCRRQHTLWRRAGLAWKASEPHRRNRLPLAAATTLTSLQCAGARRPISPATAPTRASPAVVARASAQRSTPWCCRRFRVSVQSVVRSDAHPDNRAPPAVAAAAAAERSIPGW